MSALRVVGFDPSLRNWGVAQALYHPQSKLIDVIGLAVISPVFQTGKQVRQNSKDIEAAQQLFEHAWTIANTAHAVFVEVPVGSQSSRAMASYGICVGILGSLRAKGIPFFEVTPLEVKLVATNNKTATKTEMIQWASGLHPLAPWPTHTKKGETLIAQSRAEHMADAVAAIYAGTRLPLFQQFCLMRA